MQPLTSPTIDLNSDLGEGCQWDADILPLVTCANVSCGAHAGDSETALTALAAAKHLGVRTGAHPGYPDREHFGRRDLDLGEEEIYRLCHDQLGEILKLAHLAGQTIDYIKPHGALYNQACKDDRFARPVIRLAEELKLPVLALPQSRLEVLAAGRCPFVAEGFADRRYRDDGSLVPRSQPDAFVHDPDEAVDQAERLIRDRGVQSLCVHGDNPQAVLFVRRLRDVLQNRGYTLRAFA